MTTRRTNNNLLNTNTHWWHRWHLSSQKFAILLTATAFVTGFIYVAMTNSTAANGFAMEKLEKQLTALQASNEKLQLQTADLRSLSVADRAGEALGLQPTDKFDVLPTTGGTVAVRTQ